MADKGTPPLGQLNVITRIKLIPPIRELSLGVVNSKWVSTTTAAAEGRHHLDTYAYNAREYNDYDSTYCGRWAQRIR